MSVQSLLKSTLYLICLAVIGQVAVIGNTVSADDPALTRPEMKKRIEALKSRTSRLPLPPPTEEDRASGKSLVNNGRLRSLYLPPSWTSFVISGWGGNSASRGSKGGAASTLNTLQAQPDYGFKTRIFWVVSRTNDCQYCLGHQELKLKRIGMTDDQVAALDADWSQFDAAEQTALRAARRLTLRPDQFGASEVTEILRHYSPKETRDILYTIARYNAVNRWTSATGIPQDLVFGGEEATSLDSPTSEKYSAVPSTVAPIDIQTRAPWESREELETRLTEARSRISLVELPSVAQSQSVLSRETPGVVPPEWFRAMSDLPVALDAWAQRQSMIREGKTPVTLRLLIAWVSARENRAWYSAAHARARIRASGADDKALDDFTRLQESVAPGWAAALRFAQKLTTNPQSITDSDITGLQQHFSDHEVAEIIQLTADSNAFDRFTESLKLTLEF
ncbi:MAG: hypothetical protein WCK86_14665 [Planctomycetia bacterium]